MSTEFDRHPLARQGFYVRPATLDDVDELLLLYNDYWMVMTGATNFTRDHLERVFTMPDFDLSSSTRVVISPQSAIVGSAFLEDLASPPVHPNVYGCVHADFQRRGMGTWLICWAEARGRQVFSRAPDGTRVSLCFYTSSSHESTRRLFEKLGLNAIRYSWLMLIELVQPPPAPTWPAGMHLRTFQDYPHLGAILQATDQAFQDAWGHMEAEDEEQRLRRWQHWIESDESFDPSLWFLVLDGEEIAAAARCSPRLKSDATGGEVVTPGCTSSLAAAWAGPSAAASCLLRISPPGLSEGGPGSGRGQPDRGDSSLREGRHARCPPACPLREGASAGPGTVDPGVGGLKLALPCQHATRGAERCSTYGGAGERANRSAPSATVHYNRQRPS